MPGAQHVLAQQSWPPVQLPPLHGAVVHLPVWQ
jgi:hypothetical protein